MGTKTSGTRSRPSRCYSHFEQIRYSTSKAVPPVPSGQDWSAAGQAMPQTDRSHHQVSFWRLLTKPYGAPPEAGCSRARAVTMLAARGRHRNARLETCMPAASPSAWRTPLMIVLCGCAIAMISFGPRSTLRLFPQPISRGEWLGPRRVRARASRCRTCCGAWASRSPGRSPTGSAPSACYAAARCFTRSASC